MRTPTRPHPLVIAFLVGFMPNVAWAADGGGVELPIASVLAVLTGVLVLIGFRLRSWVLDRVDPALGELESAAVRLQERARPVRLRPLTVEGEAPLQIWGQRWVQQGAVSVVASDLDALPHALIVELLGASGDGTVIFATDAPDRDVAAALETCRPGVLPLGAERVLVAPVEDCRTSPSGALAAAATRSRPLTLVLPLGAPDDVDRTVAAMRELLPRASSAAKELAAAVVICIPWPATAQGRLRVLAESDGIDTMLWWNGSRVHLPGAELSSEPERSG